MGCLCTREEKEVVCSELQSEKKYSWDKRKDSNFNAQNYIVENLEVQEILKPPGTVNGQQFIIQNCKNCVIYILDHMNTITIDDCTNCNFILGPVKGSVFVRNCKSCTCVAASGQFRVRDSRKVHVFLHCATQPIIEASSRISFANYQLSYKHMMEHVLAAGLDLEVRTWDTIHDFTPLATEVNWTFMPEHSVVTDFVSKPADRDIEQQLNMWQVTWGVDRPMLHRNSQAEPLFAL